MKKHHYYNAVIEHLENNPTLKIKENILDFTPYDENAKIHIARNLTNFRKSLSLSQVNMSKLLNISTSQYKKYESGSEVIRWDISLKLALKYGVTILDLFAHSDYATLFNLNKNYASLQKISIYANSLTNMYFEKMCDLLLSFSNFDSSFEMKPFHMTANDFNLAWEENEKHIYIALGEGLRAMRHFYDCSQEKFANLIGVSISTYQEYEKASQRPRFNMLAGAHFVAGTSIPPLCVLIGTHYCKIRFMQTNRVQIIQNILSSVDKEVTDNINPMIDGFIKTARSLPESTYFSC